MTNDMKRYRYMKKFLSLLSIFTLHSFLLAADPVELKVSGDIVEQRVENGRTKESIKPLGTNVLPQQIIEYTISAANNQDSIVKNIELNGKIPLGTSFIPGSNSEKAVFSIDNGKTFHEEPVTFTILVEGKKVQKTAAPDMYTNIKYNVSKIEPKQSYAVKYRVQVK